MPKVTWEQAADALLYSDWSESDYEDAHAYVRRSTDSRLSLVLLRDIAKSLRVLRCQNFKEIPLVLRYIRVNTSRIPTRKRRKK